MSMKTGSGNLIDKESLKALVGQSTNKVTIEKVNKDDDKGLLPMKNNKKHRGSSLRQVLASLCANVGTVNTGLMFGFSAVAIPQMEDPNTTSLLIDKVQASWIASISAVGTPIGCILSGYFMDVIGRKKILLITQLPTILGWLLIASASTIEMVYVGRLLIGLGSGMVAAPARVYTGEVTQPHLRGMLSAVASVGVSLGVLIEYLLGALFMWKIVALLSCMIPALALLGACFLPESPSWLMAAGKEDESLKSLNKLRGRNCDIESEANQLSDFAKTHNVHKPNSIKEIFQAIMSPSAIKPFIIIVMYFLIYQLSGVNPITFYAVQVFEESGTSLDKNVATVIMGVVRLLFTIVTCILMRRCGRRPLTFISSIGCGLSMLTLGIYLYFKQQWAIEGLEVKAQWIPISSMMIFTAASVSGYLVVPWVMIGEVYPTQVRGIIGGMTTCCAHFFIFLTVKTFPILQDQLESYGTFCLYGTISMLGTIFFYYFLPETKGRTLQEIEDYFSGRIKSLKINNNNNNNNNNNKKKKKEKKKKKDNQTIIAQQNVYNEVAVIPVPKGNVLP